MLSFILLCLLEGLAALLATLAGGISPTRLAFAGLLVLMLAALASAFLRLRDGDRRVRACEAIARPNVFRALTLSSSLLSLTSGGLLFLLRYLNPEATEAWFARAWPFLTFLLLLGAQAAIFLLFLKHGFHPAALRARRGLFVSAALVLGVFLALWLVVWFTGLGVTKDPSYWGEPGVPILGWQLALALLLGLGFLVFWREKEDFDANDGEAPPLPERGLLRREKRPPCRDSHRFDVLIAVSLWLLAFGLWMSVPLTVLRNSFYAPIQPPYNQPFPNSDAALYDSNAQSLLLGYGFIHKIPTRPLFITFLAGLHALFGQEYSSLVFGQTLLYALFPAALYFLAKRLHSRAAGITVALLAIFRELTSLWVSNDARVSNTKMLLSEFMSTLALVAFLLVVLRWYESIRRRRDSESSTYGTRRDAPEVGLQDSKRAPFLAFLCGGLLGLQVLLRSQSMFIAPGILLLALPILWPEWKKWIAQSILFAAGIALAVAPWLARNFFAAGELSLDDPAQILSIASMYSGGTPTSNYGLFEGQTPAEISAYVMETILQRPGYVAGFVGNQFFANLIDTLLVLPIFARYDGLAAPIHLYWYEWNGQPSAANAALFLAYLAVIALGMAAAWKKLHWAGTLPLAFYVFYIFSTSLARYSGWRYIFPADWVGYFYFALGFVELAGVARSLFGFVAQNAGGSEGRIEVLSHPAPAGQLGNWAFIAFAGLFLLVGGLPWIVETRIPRVEFACADSPFACLAERGVDASQARSFLAQPGAVSLSGRVLYPRYYARNEGIASTNPNPAYAPRDFPRTGFYFFLGERIEQVILPMKGARRFPHAADAFLLGCQRDRYVEVKMIVFPDSDLNYSNGALTDLCAAP